MLKSMRRPLLTICLVAALLVGLWGLAALSPAGAEPITGNSTCPDKGGNCANCAEAAAPTAPPPASNLVPAGEFEGGRLYQAGVINVVVLTGNFRQMGRQYGYLLKQPLHQLYSLAVDGRLVGKQHADLAEIKQLCRQSYEREPRYLQEFIQGLAETSGFSLDEQMVSAQLMFLVAEANCSGMLAWDAYTGGGPLVAGRNWDTSAGLFSDYGRFITVTVYNPTGFANPVAEVNYVGTVGWQTGMNSAGIYMDLQNGGLSDPLNRVSCTNTNADLLSWLFQYSSLAQVDAAFRATHPGSGLIINVADASRAYAYEWSTTATHRRDGDSAGLLADSNHFVDPGWEVSRDFPSGQISAFTKERRDNLLALGEKFKGQISAGKMMEIFDTTIPKGGPTFPNSGGLSTYYQIVAVPRDLTIWLKVTGVQGWTQIDLKGLFLDG